MLVDNYDLFIPKAFTPGGDDNLNNTFRPYGYGIVAFQMRIYSRWGELLFTSDNIDLGWDGSNQNSSEICQSGSYTYYIEIENIYGEIHKYEGILNLIR